MRLLTTSYLTENIADVVRDMPESCEPIGVTQDGEVRLIVQNPDEFKATQDALSMLMILNLTERQFKNGEFEDLDEAINDILNED